MAHTIREAKHASMYVCGKKRSLDEYLDDAFSFDQLFLSLFIPLSFFFSCGFLASYMPICTCVGDGCASLIEKGGYVCVCVYIYIQARRRTPAYWGFPKEEKICGCDKGGATEREKKKENKGYLLKV